MGWYLNDALTSWRAAVNATFPKRKKHSDGTIGNRAHRATVSEHNPDRDGSVDAWDADINFHGSNLDKGTDGEKRIVRELIEEFQKQPFAQLWIYDGKIANRNVGNWKVRPYYGANKHDKHIHFQSRSSKEHVEYTKDDVDHVVDAINAPEPKPEKVGSAPKWPHGDDDYYRELRNPVFRAGVLAAQRQLKKRGWRIAVDGRFGPQTTKVIKAFQKEKRLKVDGLLGPNTWRKIWEAPITR